MLGCLVCRVQVGGVGLLAREAWMCWGVALGSGADQSFAFAGGGGGTQVKERSTHARPGMHMQQCSAVLTAETDAQLSFWHHMLPLAVFCQPQTSGLHSTLKSYLTLPCRSLLKGRHSGGQPWRLRLRLVGRWWWSRGEEPMPLAGP